MKKILCLFLSFLIGCSLFVQSGAQITYASGNGLTLTVPEGTEVFLFNSLAPNTLTADSTGIAPTSAVASDGVISYYFKNLPAGSYHYEAKKDGCYSESQNILLTEEQSQSGKHIEITPKKMSGNGFEPDYTVSYTDEFLKNAMQSSPDTWGEEYSALFTTPYFLRDKSQGGIHQQTTHAEMLEFIKSLDDKNDNMYVYTIGTSPAYGYEIPLVIFTKEDIAVTSSLEEIATVFKNNQKPTIHYQAQIHSNEPAAGEAALAAIKQLDSGYGETVLDNVDVYVIPRINADGAYDNIRRSVATGEDMNDDYMYMNNKEIRMVTSVYNMFLPEVAIDAHEQNQHAYKTDGTLTDLDMQANGGLTHNDLKLTDTAIEIMRKAQSNAKTLGLRAGCYNGNYHGNSTINGTAYYATRGSISFLFETRGIYAGMNWAERRVMSQYVAASTIIDYAAKNSQTIVELCKNNRDNIIKKGATYEEDDNIGLKHISTYDENTIASPKIDYLTGEVIDPDNASKVRIFTTFTRSRTRPTAYVIPKGEKWADSALDVLKCHAVEYYELENGASARLVQYKGSASATELCDEKTVSFENGAYVFPMNQSSAAILALIMEPDVHNANNDKINLLSMGFAEPDENGLMPIYRYCYGLKDGKIILEAGKDSSITGWENPYTDVKYSDWHYDSVKYAASNNLFKGTSENEFSPDETLTRAMLVTVLYRSEGEPAVNKAIPFADVAMDAYYANAVIWAQQNGIVKGTDETHFSPDEKITREQFATIIYCYAVLKGKDVSIGENTNIQSYEDFSEISEYAIPAMQYTAGADLIKGKTQSTLNPADGTTRAEAAAVLYRFFAGDILSERREIADKYMRDMANILWRSDKDILYTTSSNVLPRDAAENKQFKIVAGRLYKGVPYTYSGGTGESFLQYATSVDENGIYTISGLDWEALSGGSASARIGNDCSATVGLAWGQFAGSIQSASTKNMAPAKGYLKVGDYVADVADNTNSWKTTQLVNGYDRMYRAYSKLQKADAVVYRGGSGGHAMFVTDVNVVYASSGEIDGENSTVTVVEQTSKNFLGEKKYYDEALGEDVYYIFGVDVPYTFKYLVDAGYMPITCKELVDPAQAPQTVVKDSLSQYSADTIFTGTVSSNRFMDYITVTITDKDGTTVQKATARANRNKNYSDFDMQNFVTDPSCAVVGKVDVKNLSAGSYRCTVTCRMVNGEEFKVRDFEFTK
ncbi:MAG: S-layer homology domain-containing protein [Clostridia bacterium]|nr:S-layer homology domain-containing protein [Clostridia bacterium]